MKIGSPHTEPYIMDFAAICLGCGAVAEVTREQLHAARCAYDHREAIEPRLRCMACGVRNARLAVGTFMGAEDAP